MAEANTPGEKMFDVVTEILLYAFCLWATWRIGGLMTDRFWGIMAVFISILLFARAEQCRRETRRAGDHTTGFYIMVPLMCGITLLLRVWLQHRMH